MCLTFTQCKFCKTLSTGRMRRRPTTRPNVSLSTRSIKKTLRKKPLNLRKKRMPKRKLSRHALIERLPRSLNRVTNTLALAMKPPRRSIPFKWSLRVTLQNQVLWPTNLRITKRSSRFTSSKTLTPTMRLLSSTLRRESTKTVLMVKLKLIRSSYLKLLDGA